jgi:hypothetical protein
LVAQHLVAVCLGFKADAIYESDNDFHNSLC